MLIAKVNSDSQAMKNNIVFYMLFILLCYIPQYGDAECSQYYVMLMTELKIDKIEPILTSKISSLPGNLTDEYKTILEHHKDCILELGCLTNTQCKTEIGTSRPTSIAAYEATRSVETTTDISDAINEALKQKMFEEQKRKDIIKAVAIAAGSLGCATALLLLLRWGVTALQSGTYIFPSV